MEPYKLSPHKLNLYQECQRCFWEEKHGLKRPSGPFPSLPSGMDKILKQYFDGVRKNFDEARRKSELPDELSALENITLYTGRELKEWQNQWKGLRWTNEQGHVLSGALDDVLQTAKGELLVLDYKTRGFPLKAAPTYYTLQLECYTFLLQKNGFKTGDKGYLLFYWPEKFLNPTDVKFSLKLVEVNLDLGHAEQTFTDAIKVLEGEKPKANEECNFCQYRRI